MTRTRPRAAIHADATRNVRPPARLTPLGIALALALSGGASPATGASAPPVPRQAPDRAAAWPGNAVPQPDGSLLWLVENCNDTGPGSLRDAAAHALHGDGIDLSALTCSTISLRSGAITLHDGTLFGPGAADLVINGAGNNGQRIFNHASNGGGLTIGDVTLHGAKYQSDAGRGGGCLRSSGGQLRIHDAVFDGCWAFAPIGTSGAVRGGAIAAYGSYVQLSGVTLSNNQARSANGDALGGGLYMAGNNLSIESSTITNNSATTAGTSNAVHGGGLFTRGWAGIFKSTIDGNLSEGFGGGAFIEAGGMMTSSTVSNNASIGGGSGIAFLGAHAAAAGVYSSTIVGNETQASTQWGSGALYMNTAPATIDNSTIAGNIESNTQGVAHGAGILFGFAADHYLLMRSTIVHGNHLRDSSSGADIGGPLGYTVGGNNNLIGVSLVHTPADTVHGDPRLGPLQDNGGPTLTRMPASDGTAIDRGDDNGRETDQRGFPRVQGPAADIGAVETAPAWDTIFADGFDPCTGPCP